MVLFALDLHEVNKMVRVITTGTNEAAVRVIHGILLKRLRSVRGVK
jgi:hypothetical protein